MGLTGNQTATAFLSALNQFKAEVAQELEKINNKLEILECRIFEEAVLNLQDDDWESIRLKRNYLLKSTDWVMTPGSTINPAAWAEYRQFLRDLPQRYEGIEPSEVVWPAKPSLDGPNTSQLE
jgi:hypothetical protein